jgi:hypothetical protein
MAYLKGEQVKIDTPTLKKMVGTKVEYLLERDIDKTGRGYFSPNKGTITEIIRKQVDFGNGCPEPFSSIREIVLR